MAKPKKRGKIVALAVAGVLLVLFILAQAAIQRMVRAPVREEQLYSAVFTTLPVKTFSGEQPFFETALEAVEYIYETAFESPQKLGFGMEALLLEREAEDSVWMLFAAEGQALRTRQEVAKLYSFVLRRDARGWFAPGQYWEQGVDTGSLTTDGKGFENADRVCRDVMQAYYCRQALYPFNGNEVLFFGTVEGDAATLRIQGAAPHSLTGFTVNGTAYTLWLYEGRAPVYETVEYEVGESYTYAQLIQLFRVEI